MKTISAVLKKKGPYFNVIDSSVLLMDALLLMKAENLSYLIVVHEDVFHGIFTEHDFAQMVVLAGEKITSKKISEVDWAKPPGLSGENTTDEAMQIMNSSQSFYLPVFDDFEFQGVITINDLVREVIADRLRSEQSAMEYVV